MVSKRNIRALIETVKEGKGNISRSNVLGLISYYLGEVTKEDRDKVRNS